MDRKEFFANYGSKVDFGELSLEDIIKDLSVRAIKGITEEDILSNIAKTVDKHEEEYKNYLSKMRH